MQISSSLRPWAVSVLVLAAVACAGSGDRSLPRPSRAFCEAAHRYDVRVERRAPIEEQIRIVTRMARHAPPDVAADAAIFRDALKRRRDGDLSVVDNPRIEDAVNHVNRRAATGCGFYTDNGGGM